MRFRRLRHKHDDAETALSNFALTFAKAMLVFCVVLFVMITDDAKKSDGIKPKVEAVIIVEWSKDAKVDVDTWVRTTQNELVYYGNKESGVVFLDRDDLGGQCKIVCEEITSIRGLDSGEYVLNLNVYNSYKFIGSANSGTPLQEPLTVHVKIIKMNPEVVILWEKDITLRFMKEEKSVVRWNVSNGKFENFDTERPINIMPRAGLLLGNGNH